MENETGNAAIAAPDSLPPESVSSDDFFAALDGDVNRGILDDDSSLNLSSKENTKEGVVREVQQEDVETLKKRYADSSREGKRLNTRLTELKPYLPILDEMRKDPKLITHVRDYFKGGGQTPESITQKLELGEDFIFDPDEAVTNPKSDSAKVLNSTIDGVVQKRLGEEDQKRKEESKVHSEIDDFRNKHDMTMDQWEEFKTYADARPLSLEDILYLKNREDGIEAEPESRNAGVMERASQHIRNTQSKPKSLASVGSTVSDVSEEDEVFDAIMGIDKQLESAFG